MERHVRLLAILAYLWGALAVLVGVSMLLLAAGAFAIVAGPETDAVALAAGVTTAVFAAIGAFSLLWGGLHLWAAALLRRHRPIGRVVMLGLSLVNLLVFPFGTGLGVYGMWILLTNDGRRLFEGVQS